MLAYAFSCDFIDLELVLVGRAMKSAEAKSCGFVSGVFEVSCLSYFVFCAIS